MSAPGQSPRGFLGAGTAFPIRLDANGAIATTALEDHVRQSVEIILATRPGERIMRPTFGAGLDALVFSPITAGTAAMVVHQVQDALTVQEPRIAVLAVTAATDPDSLETVVVQVTYRIRSTDTVFNLVYPYNLERGSGGLG